MIVLVFIFGLLVGSFLNVCIYRIPRGESISFPPSHCTNCKNKIKFYDLIPIISYIFLKGRCRHCGEKISIRYPIVELFTAIVWSLIYVTYGYSMNTLKFIFLVSLIIVTAIIDYDTQDVYFSTTLFGVIGAVIFIIFEVMINKNLDINYIYLIKDYVLGGIIPTVIIGLIAFITKGMGFGDSEVIFICGLFLGLKKSLFLLFLSFLIGGIYGAGVLICKRKKGKDPIAFVPFIGIAAIVTIIWGENLIGWYINYIIM